MADAVASNVRISTSRRYKATFVNLSDGTGEAAVAKVDISTLVGAPTAVKIRKVQWSTSGMDVAILFDHTTDDRVLVLSGQGFLDFGTDGLKDPASAGATGDILFTTIGHTLNDSYSVDLDVDIT